MVIVLQPQNDLLNQNHWHCPHTRLQQIECRIVRTSVIVSATQEP